jgi:hypothetical protein
MFLQGCEGSAPSLQSAPIAVRPAEFVPATAPSTAENEHNTPSCPTLLARHIEIINQVTEKTIQNTKFIQDNGTDSIDYNAQMVALSEAGVRISQDLLAFCGDRLDPSLHESILADLVGYLAGAGRAKDALLVANECSKQFPESPYCVAGSAKAFYALHKNTQARFAAEQVVRRGPFDAKMQSEINDMQALITLIDAEEKLRKSQIRNPE